MAKCATIVDKLQMKDIQYLELKGTIMAVWTTPELTLDALEHYKRFIGRKYAEFNKFANKNPQLTTAREAAEMFRNKYNDLEDIIADFSYSHNLQRTSKAYKIAPYKMLWAWPEVLQA